jgi:hypothetical protein
MRPGHSLDIMRRTFATPKRLDWLEQTFRRYLAAARVTAAGGQGE